MEINATLFGQLITFILLVWFIKRYVWPPIIKNLRDREAKIAAGLEEADHAKRALEDASHKAMTIIRDAKVEAAHLIEQAHKRTVQMIEEAKDAARIEAERVIERAQNDIALEITQAKEALRKQLATLAVAGAEKIIRRNLDVATQTSLLDEFEAEI